MVVTGRPHMPSRVPWGPFFPSFLFKPVIFRLEREPLEGPWAPLDLRATAQHGREASAGVAPAAMTLHTPPQLSSGTPSSHWL